MKYFNNLLPFFAIAPTLVTSCPIPLDGQGGLARREPNPMPSLSNLQIGRTDSDVTKRDPQFGSLMVSSLGRGRKGGQVAVKRENEKDENEMDENEKDENDNGDRKKKRQDDEDSDDNNESDNDDDEDSDDDDEDEDEDDEDECDDS